jgi:hypothetical protein
MFIATIIVSMIVGVAVSDACAQAETTTSVSNEKWFDEIIGIENSGIINGPEYKMGMLAAHSNPFFVAGEEQGSVNYNSGVFYVPLIYDIYKDELIVKYMSASSRGWFIQLDKQYVDQFVIGKHVFRNFPGKGFYEVLFEKDNFQLVCKRAKALEVRKAIFNYVQNDQFFIVDSGEWKSVRNASGFINILTTKEDRKKIKLFIRQNHIKVRRFRDKELVEVVRFINVIQNK